MILQSSVKLNFIRSYNLYFSAQLKSNEEAEDLEVKFVIKYLYELGKLSAGGINVDDKKEDSGRYGNLWKGEVVQ